jgi:molybdopterin synthase catalytic subunit
VIAIIEWSLGLRHSNDYPDQPAAVPRSGYTKHLMRVRVLFFGMLRESVGKSSEEIELPKGASVRDVLGHYESQIPRLGESIPSLAVAVNQQYARFDTELNANDEIALLPPVSGGAPGSVGATSSQKPAQGSGHASITREKIDTQFVADGLKRGEDGASVVFEGVVRNQTRGRKTRFLDYEAYEQMALQQMESLAAQAIDQFKVRDVAIVHRLGRLEIGETSVLIAVASAHRGPAFDACRWIIDTLKRTVPIWKKEHFEDGAVWADGEPFPAEIPRANS